jgi:hypothetical protein
VLFMRCSLTHSARVAPAALSVVLTRGGATEAR